MKGGKTIAEAVFEEEVNKALDEGGFASRRAESIGTASPNGSDRIRKEEEVRYRR